MNRIGASLAATLLACLFTPLPGTAQAGHNNYHAFYFANGHLIQLYSNSTGWHWNDVTALTGVPGGGTDSVFTGYAWSTGVHLFLNVNGDISQRALEPKHRHLEQRRYYG